jgi:phospholipid/cholesterol/gamma-HCH transport system substrate-binding protein
MSDSVHAGRVGAFAIAGIVLLAALFLTFSKGLSWFTSGYTLRLHTDNAGGLKSRSAVLVSGVAVGTVVGTELAPDGKGVTILLKMDKRYRIHSDAEFVVEQIGLLGDQYVVVYPTKNQGPLLKDGDEVSCRAPFSFHALAMSTIGFIERVDETTKVLKEAVVRINEKLLTDETLTNLAHGIGDLHTASERTIALIDNLNRLVSTNSSPLTGSFTNLGQFSRSLTTLAADLRETVAENRTNIATTVRNLEESSRAVKDLTKDLEEGKGLAGSFFKDQQLPAQLSNTLHHLAIVSSNIARFGLLYKPKPAKPESSHPVRSPRNLAD